METLTTTAPERAEPDIRETPPAPSPERSGGAGESASAGAAASGGRPAGRTAAATKATEAVRAGKPRAGGVTPEEAFDRLYQRHAATLIRQCALLCGHRGLAERAVTRAFELAWQRWPEVAVDRDPAGWVRAAAHDVALSPWHRMRPGLGRAQVHPGPPEDRELLEALTALHPCYRRSVLLYDGLGLGLPETAAEMEASTRATAHRITGARHELAERVPRLGRLPVEQRDRALGVLLRDLAAAQPVRLAPVKTVRMGSERATRRWVWSVTTLMLVLLSMVTVTAVTGSGLA
ncbi:RNA polymerase subunit sigma-24 [Streptomyces sp. ACA25]|uniref:RNA polymerase subunit sigma-24 n=1 Tax=Streptomyces sp. ACA25 TaxID=3022596 RepID=UPI00230750FC|nr:RNA polymerase subunit sigma-24 [Streptomyces sp. ACA25]MDB1087374.1 RNA polymerase subunit sigma-24 [Streptomyces sp. ACA25]